MSIGVTIDSGLLCGGFLVGLEVEVDEKTQVASKQGTSKQRGSFVACTVSHVGEVIIIGISVMLIG